MAASAARAHALLLSADDPVGAAAVAVVRFQLRAFAREQSGARAGDVEAVHQLRVATRRLRAALRFFAPALPAAAVRQARTDLRWLGRAIGAVRDLDVLGEAVRAEKRDLDPAIRRAVGPLEELIAARRAATHTGLPAALDAPRTRRLLARLALLEPGAGRQRLGTVAPELVKPLLRAVRKAGRKADRDPSPERLHRLRVRIKRLRYALETVRTLGGKPVAKMVGRLEQLQQLLGDHQDAVTQVAWLRGQTDLPPATLVATGVLLEVLGRHARRYRRRFPRAWRRFHRGKLRRRVRRRLARAEGAPRPPLVLVPRRRAAGA